MYNDSRYCILKMLINVVGILYFAGVLKADQISSSLVNRPTLGTPKADVQNDSTFFVSNAESGKDTQPVWSPRPIALEGGSSVTAKDTKVSNSVSTSNLIGNRTSIESATANQLTVTTNKPHILIKYNETQDDLRQRISTTVKSNVRKTSENDATYFSKDPLQLTLEDSEHPSVVARKGVSPKIVPRKGVEPFEQFSLTSNETEIKPECVCCEIPNSDQQRENYTLDEKCTLCCNVSDSEVFNISSSVGVNNIDNSIFKADFKNQTVSKTNRPTAVGLNRTDAYGTSSQFRKKAKPLVTLGDDIEEKQILMRSSNSENSDFVIPVVLVILAVPIAVVLAMIFYRKGTEFWERRHYRRMDFLIDGMYND